MKVDVKIGGAVVVTAPFELVVVKNTGLDNVVCAETEVLWEVEVTASLVCEGVGESVVGVCVVDEPVVSVVAEELLSIEVEEDVVSEVSEDVVDVVSEVGGGEGLGVDVDVEEEPEVMEVDSELDEEVDDDEELEVVVVVDDDDDEEEDMVVGRLALLELLELEDGLDVGRGGSGL